MSQNFFFARMNVHSSPISPMVPIPLFMGSPA
jgi:hypothetical protein